MRRSAACVFILAVLISTCDSAAAALNCPHWFTRLAQAMRLKSPKFTVHLENSELQILTDIRGSRPHRTFVNSDGVEVEVPQQIRVKGETYTIAEQLGFGDEGIVYRGLDKNGDSVTVKQYHVDGRGTLPHERLVAAQKAGIPTVADASTWDPDTRTAVYRYVHGLSVREIDSSADIPKPVKEKILQKFEEWKTYFCQPRSNFSNCSKRNIVFDFESRSFVLIDAI